MSSLRLDDNSFSVDFSLELLSVFDFGGFELPGGSLFSFGSYENEYDDASFSFSVESYVYLLKKALSLMSFFMKSMFLTNEPASDKRHSSIAALFDSLIL